MSEIQFKIGTFGESRVGKTSIINQYAHETFNPSEESSIAPSTSNKAIEINSEDVLLKIWDTAGQERYMALTKQYFEGLDGILLVYDVTVIESFEKIQFWVDTIKGTIDIETVEKYIDGWFLDHYYKTFMSCKGIALRYGVYDYGEAYLKGLTTYEETEIMRPYLEAKGSISEELSEINNYQNSEERYGCYQ